MRTDKRKKAANGTSNWTALGFDATLWAAVEYKHVVLGLVFLKYKSNTFCNCRRPDFKTDYVPASSPFLFGAHS